LLLDATRKERDLKTVFGAYKKLQPSKLIFSKVDESDSIGNLFNIKIQSGLPVSYLTVGQRVPEDIEVAHPRRVASRLLGLFGSNGGRL
jgi:flagellar biosynthesis protein FlhF